VDGLTTWVTPTPVTAHGLLFVASNGPGGNVVMAIRPGGSGNITSSHVAWRYDRSAPYSSSPIVLGDHLYLVRNGGVMTCLDARSGRLVWQERLPARGSYYASLVGGAGRVYALSEDGDATTVDGGTSFKVLGASALRERTMATPAIAGGRLYIRSDATLFAIGR
jgi:outer membrane protein assembly factor BamB